MINTIRKANEVFNKFLLGTRKELRASDKFIRHLFNGETIYEFKEVEYYIK